MRHGTLSAYKNHRCRCEPCSEAHRVYKRDLYKRKRDGLSVQAHYTGLSEKQKVYLWAFEEHLRTRDSDEQRLELVKEITDRAASRIGATPRSHATRDWMDLLIDDMRRLGGDT